MSPPIRVERPSPDDLPPVGAFSEVLRRWERGAGDLLPALPRDAQAWGRVLDGTRRGREPLSAGLVERLVARQRELGGGPNAAAAAASLGEPGTVAVVTGQQPGLLGGPTMTFHKIAGAIHLARRLDGGASRRVVPVFWLASEDHDVVEANRALLLDREGQVRRLALDRQPDGRSLMHHEVSADEAEDLLALVASCLPDTARTRAAMDALVHTPGDDFATWSARCLVRLLGDTELVVVEPSVVLPFAGEALADLATSAPEIRGAMTAATRTLASASLPTPLEIGPGYVPLFLRESPSGPRLRVTSSKDGTLQLRGRRSDWTLASLSDRLRECPELGSGDAAGRVFVQNTLLPTLAYVGGPTEIAYLAQVSAAYAALERTFPLAVPRPAATWADAKAARVAEAYGLSLDQVLSGGPTPAPPGPALDPDDLEAVLEAWEMALEEVPLALQARMEGAGQGPEALRRAARRVREALRREKSRVREAFARDRGTGAGRWARLQALLFPRGRPQERELSAVSVAARYGLDAFRDGLAELDPLERAHYLLVAD